MRYKCPAGIWKNWIWCLGGKIMIRHLGLRTCWFHDCDGHTGHGVVRADHEGLKLWICGLGDGEGNESLKIIDMTTILIY